jgi:NADP-dependent 3-hydroxy acid dehydrogenase YdfG
MSRDYWRGKVVWITGASSGVGEGLATVLGREGARLILSARHAAELERVRAALGAAESLVLPMDVTDIAAIPAAVEQALAWQGHVDVLVCNAGTSQRSRIVDTRLDTYRRLMEINFFAPVAHILALLPAMRARKSGHIVVTSSVAGKYGVPNRAGYSAAKHAVQGFCDTLRAELAADGIKVSTLIIAAVKSKAHANALTATGEPTGKPSRWGDAGMEPIEAGRIIARGLARGQPEVEVVAQWRAKAPLLLKRFFPRAVDLMLAKLAQSKFWQ